MPFILQIYSLVSTAEKTNISLISLWLDASELSFIVLIQNANYQTIISYFFSYLFSRFSAALIIDNL